TSATEAQLHDAVDEHQAQHLEGGRCGWGGQLLDGVARGRQQRKRALAIAGDGVNGGEDLIGTTEEAIGRSQSIDAHVSSALVIVGKKACEATLRLGAAVEVKHVPQLSAQGADSALDLAAAARTIRSADDMIDELGFEKATEITLLREGDKGAAAI